MKRRSLLHLAAAVGLLTSLAAGAAEGCDRPCVPGAPTSWVLGRAHGEGGRSRGTTHRNGRIVVTMVPHGCPPGALR